MKIGIFDPYLDTLGGGEKYMLTAAICLSENNSVDIFWENEPEIRKKAEHRFSIDLSPITFTKNIFSSKISPMQRILRTKKYDTIIYLSNGSIPIVGAKNLIIHFQFPVEWVNPSFLIKQKMKRAHAIICNSFFTKSFIDKKFGVKSIVLYPPISTSQTKTAKKESIILNVGRFNINDNGSIFKKQDILIDVFKKMIDQGLKNWELVLVISVSENDRNSLEKLQSTTKAYPITFIINPSNELLWQYYKKAKIYWHASGFGEDLKQYPEKAEHFGIATVEAMSMGAVPVVINAGGQKEIVENNKNGLLWNLTEELIQRTKLLIDDEKLLKSFSEKAKIRAEFFTGDRFCKELKEIIK